MKVFLYPQQHRGPGQCQQDVGDPGTFPETNSVTNNTPQQGTDGNAGGNFPQQLAKLFACLTLSEFL
jgi:hypothetical protein